mgnify:FL=1
MNLLNGYGMPCVKKEKEPFGSGFYSASLCTAVAIRDFVIETNRNDFSGEDQTSGPLILPLSSR